MHKLTILVLFLAAVVVASAQGPGRGPGGRGPGGGGPRIANILDLNGDREISSEELRNAGGSLRILDTNNNDQVTVEELMVAALGRGGPGGRGRGGDAEGARPPDPQEVVDAYMAFDKNSDGKLAKAELPERMQGAFDQADTSKDGFLTKEELLAMSRASMSTSGAQARGGEGEVRGRGEGRGGFDPAMLKNDPLFRAIDTDGNGVLSANEITYATVSLRKLDRDGSGTLNAEEMSSR